jgi:hypothetical protein
MFFRLLTFSAILFKRFDHAVVTISGIELEEKIKNRQSKPEARRMQCEDV